nr:MAG TPA: hypothetical protein [Bacteriophage sp.]
MNYKEIENKIKEIYENNKNNYYDKMRKLLEDIPLTITITQTYNLTPDNADFENLYFRISDNGEGFESAITKACATDLEYATPNITATIRNQSGDVLYHNIIDEEEL